MAGPPYRPLDAQLIPRFAGIRTFMRAPHVTDLAGVDAVVYGIPFDTATSYRTGPRFGPEAIRSASTLLRPYNPALEVNVVDALSIVDYGDLPVSPGDTERTYAQVEEALAPIVATGAFVAALGGDHSITLAELRALARKHGPLALVQLDSHGDVWEQYFGQQYFHGTTFKRAVEEGLLDASASVQAGMRGSLYGTQDLQDARDLGFTVLSTDELRDLGPVAYGELVRETVGAKPVFVSFDIDFLDPAFAPGTGTPEVGGFSTAEALAFVRALRGVSLVGCDVVEVSPPYDGPGMVTALAAANRPLRALVAEGARVNIRPACLTFDVDAEAPILAESGLYARNAGLMSHQAYGPLVGVPRILDLLRSTRCRRRSSCRAGRPTATRHRRGDPGGRSRDRSPLLRPLLAVRADRGGRACRLRARARVASLRGAEVEGFRCPSWEPGWRTPQIVAEHGLAYDSSLMDADKPYLLDTGVGEIVELPVHWSLDDWEQYAYIPDPPFRSPIESPAKVLDLWISELDAMRRYGCLYVLTCHPFLSGRPHRVEVLRTLIEHALASGEVEFGACRDVARRAREDPALDRRLLTPVEIEPGLFPDTA